jgi:hypothetical protein
MLLFVSFVCVLALYYCYALLAISMHMRIRAITIATCQAPHEHLSYIEQRSLSVCSVLLSHLSLEECVQPQ